MYYVLVKNGYEYDDEGYASGSHYGDVYEKIAKVYTSKKKAEGAALELNRKEFVGLNPFDYDPYRYDGQRYKDEFAEAGIELPKEAYLDYRWRIPECDVATLDKYIKAFNKLKFWSVLEVE